MLNHFITSKVRRKIILLFSKHPDFDMHVRGIAKAIKEDPGNTQRELTKLEEIGYVTSRKEKNTKIFSVNHDFIIYEELRNIVLKTTATSRLNKYKRSRAN